MPLKNIGVSPDTHKNVKAHCKNKGKTVYVWADKWLNEAIKQDSKPESRSLNLDIMQILVRKFGQDSLHRCLWCHSSILDGKEIFYPGYNPDRPDDYSWVFNRFCSRECMKGFVDCNCAMKEQAVTQ